MAFTGTATIKPISDRCVRVTGLTLAGAAVGTIGLHGKTVSPDVSLPASFNPQPYGYEGAKVTLIDSVRVTMNVDTSVTTLVPVSVVKTGTTHADFVITFTNTTVATTSAELEIYVEFRD